MKTIKKKANAVFGTHVKSKEIRVTTYSEKLKGHEGKDDKD